MATLIWGSYARFVSKPIVAATVIVVVIATNVGLILGSEMWSVPLATEISKLWIDPASQVARNNRIVETFGSKVDGSFNELTTLGNADGSNMLTADSLQKWFDYIKVVYDTVVIVNGTAFTLLDVCNGRLGQSPYIFGCSVTNPIDYFQEGGFFHPEDGTAQFILDTRLAYNKIAGNTVEDKANLWGWAITADSASRGKVSVFNTYFTLECLNTRKVFCGNNTVFLQQVNELLANPAAPAVLKFQLAWSKAQLAAGAMYTGVTTVPAPSCAGPFDMLTVANTESAALSFTDPTLLAQLTPFGFQNGQKYSMANCAFQDATTACPTSNCTIPELQNTALYNFSSPCAHCIMSTMYWLGDAGLINSANNRAGAAPSAGILSVAGSPSFQLYVENTTGSAAGDFWVTTAADKIKTAGTGLAFCGTGATNILSTIRNTNITAAHCVVLWDKFVTGTVAGITALSATAQNNTILANLNFAIANNMTKERAGLLATAYGRAEIELARSGLFTKAIMDAQWRSLLRSPEFATLNADAKAASGAIRRHASRPSFVGKDTTELGRTLSGFKNDLLTQNLRGAIFGSAQPPPSTLRGGRCQCAPGYAGLNCSLPKDDICTCNQDLAPSCMTKLLGSCSNLAPCATYPVIMGLVAAAPGLGLTGPLIDSFSTFPREMTINAAFAKNSTVAQADLLAQCQKALPCVDNSSTTATPFSSFIPTNYAAISADATYNFALIGDLNAPATKPRFGARGTVYALGCAALGASCVTAMNAGDAAFLTAINGYTFDGDDVDALACLTTDGTLGGCITTNTKASSPVAWNIADYNSSCPSTATFFNATYTTLGLTHLTVAAFWACYAEHKQNGNPLTSYQVPQGPRADSLIWPKSSVSDLKFGACAAGFTQVEITKANCTNALSALLIRAVDQTTKTLSPSNPAAALAFFSASGSVADFDKLSAATKVLSSTLGGYLGAGQSMRNMADAIFGGCSVYNATCNVFRGTVDAALSGACSGAQLDFPIGARVTYLEKPDCLTVIQNLPGVLSTNATAKAIATLNVGKSLARYKFTASVAGACAETGGSAVGGGDCWEDSDCSSATGQGTCGDLGNATQLTFVKKFAAITFSNSPEGTKKTLSAIEARYRQLANAPILARYAAANPSRRQLQQSFGTLGAMNLTVEQADEVIKAWRAEMLRNVDEYRTANAGSAKPDAVSADSPETLLDEISKADPKILILGYGLMLLYAFLACTNWSMDVPAMLNGSRGLVAMSGIILVAISVASGLGVSHLMNVEWSAAATQIVPFVMLGLGVSDVFIMLRTFPTYRDGVSASEAAVKGLTLAGPSMLLVTVTNAGVFAMGVLTAMPVVVNFALQAVIVTITNYITVNTVMPALLIMDYHRQAKGKMDMLPCVVVGTSARAQATQDGEYDANVFNRLCVPLYSKFILSIIGKIFILALSTAFIASAIYGVEGVAELGLQLSDIAPAGSTLAEALITRDENFGFYTMGIVTDEADWSQREVQQGIIQVFNDVMATEKIVDGSGTPWMKAFMAWGIPQTPGYNPYDVGQPCHPGNSRTSGNCGLVNNCTVITADASIVLEGKIPFYNETDFYRCLNIWINADVGYDALKPGFPLVDELAPKGARQVKLVVRDGKSYIPYSRGTLITSGLQTNADFVQLIEEVRAVANSSTTPPTFPVGEPIDFWDQYVSLKAIINSAVGYGLLICWISIFFLLVGLAEGDSGFVRRVIASLWAASLVTGIIAMTVYEIYGYMAFSGLKISAIPAISIIMCTGVAVEYTAYIAVQFINAPGDRNARAHRALMIMMAPTIDGAVTMFLGVVMLAASPFQFIVKYFFIPWLFIIGFGFFNGVAVLPVLFSLIGPIAINSAKGKSVADEGGSKELGFSKQ